MVAAIIVLVVNRDSWRVGCYIALRPRTATPTTTHHSHATVASLAATAWTTEEALMDAVFACVMHQGLMAIRSRVP